MIVPGKRGPEPPLQNRQASFYSLTGNNPVAFYNIFARSCGGIHSGRVKKASPIELTTSRIEAPQARRACASSWETYTWSFLHRAQPKTRGPERGSRSSSNVVVHVFSWSPARYAAVMQLIRNLCPLFRSVKSRQLKVNHLTVQPSQLAFMRHKIGIESKGMLFTGDFLNVGGWRRRP